MDSLSWWRIIGTFDEHSCDKSNNKTNHKFRIKGMASAMAKLFGTNFGKCDSLYTPNELRDDIRTQYGTTISYKQGYTGCKRGIEMIRGSITRRFHDGDAAAHFFRAATAYTPCHYNNAIKDFL
ncbi:hypothetical protein MKX01_019494 [Papaver californicum]|nr:hypothetical protein MKX01_019494 [Papaver californicum]